MKRKKSNSPLPQVSELFKPVLAVLVKLGGSGSIEEINEGVYQFMGIPETTLAIPHGSDGRSEVDYRLAWARTMLKRYGLLENSSRGVWALSKSNINLEEVDPELIEKSVRQSFKEQGKQSQNTVPDLIEEQNGEVASWREQLLETLYNISPAAFERLAQRILRESGFFQVEVTGKTGDGGIDGKGIVKINGFLSFHVIFQCKRYRNSVTATQIRDFRGAMQGRADKGLVITTGTFTRDALKEATRDGAPPIDMIDGEQLCDKLKELKLGLDIELVENVKVRANWFTNL